MQTVILCGGRGFRMGCEDLPKPMFGIGNKPILWHIMQIYKYYGFGDFILCMGYKKDKIEEYFRKGKRIIFADTGLDTNTGGRIFKVKPFIKEEIFFATYGDGLSNVNIRSLLKFHKKHKKLATVVAVRPRSQFGIMSIDSHTGAISHFEEKPFLDHWINGGFFVFDRRVYKYLGKNSILESDCLPRLASDKQIAAYKHEGFWECMDTYKDNLRLNQFWNEGNAPWAVWKKKGKN